MTCDGQFKRSLLRLVQTGTLQASLGCSGDQNAQIEFKLERTYHVHMTPKYAALHEHEAEAVWYHTNGRRRTLCPVTRDRGRVIVERATGQIVREIPDA